MKKQSWVFILIEAKTTNLFQRYFETPENVTLPLKEAHALVKDYNFQFWYYCPSDLEAYAWSSKMKMTHKQWKNAYRKERLQKQEH